MLIFCVLIIAEYHTYNCCTSCMQSTILHVYTIKSNLAQARGFNVGVVTQFTLLAAREL